MTHPDGDWLADLDPTEWERQQLDEVIGETDAEQAAGLPGDDGMPPEGPWDDQLSSIGDTLDATHALDGKRIGEDIVAEIERRPTDEQRLARAMRRIEDGTYTEPPQLRPARDAWGQYTSACGDTDDFGRCSARFHDRDCHVVTDAAAATGSAEAVEAWRDTLNARTPHGGIDAEALGLANGPQPGDGTDTWADLLADPGGLSGYELIRARIMHEMAVADAPPRSRDPAAPDVSALRAALGL
jgi:hypothetical protein